MTVPSDHLSTLARKVAIWSCIGLAFFLPIATATSNLLYVAILIGWVGSGNWQRKWQAVSKSGAARMVGLMAIIVLAGTAYGLGSVEERLHYANKYSVLLLIPLLISLELNIEEKRRVVCAFCAAMALTLALSILVWLNWMPVHWFKMASPENPTVFKLHITHGFFMAIAAFAAGVAVLKGPPLPTKAGGFALYGFIILAGINTLFMIQGRTGQVVLLMLLAYLFHLRFPRFGLLIGIASAILLSLLAYTISPTFKERVEIAVAEAQHWQTSRGDLNSSIGTRLDLYTTTAGIIRKHSFFGVGTGGFAEAYREQIEGSALPPSENPHNQYLLTAAQFGVFGLATLLAFYYICWREIRRQAPFIAYIGCGVLYAYLAANLFNSFMLDFSERFFFALVLGCLLSIQSQSAAKEAV